MIWQPKNTKKIFLLFLSLLLGGAIIFGALIMSGLIGEKKGGEPSDEWKDGLSVVSGVDTLAQVKRGGENRSEPSVQATSTTDIIAGKLLSEYVISQKNNTSPEMSDEDAQRIATSLEEEIRLPPQKEYILSDLNISNDNSHNANLLYLGSLNSRLKSFTATSEKETELTLLKKVVDSDDTIALSKLDEKIIIYQKLIEDLLILKTPSNVAPLHLRLIQGYEILRYSTVGFKKMLSDPVVAIASMGEYRSGIDVLALAEKDLREFKF